VARSICRKQKKKKKPASLAIRPGAPPGALRAAPRSKRARACSRWGAMKPSRTPLGLSPGAPSRNRTSPALSGRDPASRPASVPSSIEIPRPSPRRSSWLGPTAAVPSADHSHCQKKALAKNSACPASSTYATPPLMCRRRSFGPGPLARARRRQAGPVMYSLNSSVAARRPLGRTAHAARVAAYRESALAGECPREKAGGPSGGTVPHRVSDGIRFCGASGCALRPAECWPHPSLACRAPPRWTARRTGPLPRPISPLASPAPPG